MQIKNITSSQVLNTGLLRKNDKKEETDKVILGKTEEKPEFLSMDGIKKQKASADKDPSEIPMPLFSPLGILGGIGSMIAAGALYSIGGPVATVMTVAGGALTGGMMGAMISDRQKGNKKQIIASALAGAIAGGGAGIAAVITKDPLAVGFSVIGGIGVVGAFGSVGGGLLNEALS
mgnify:CR=1 FL=1